MGLKCLLGRHRYGLPRLDDRGAVVVECAECLRVTGSAARIGHDTAGAALAEARRREAVEELVARGIWVGTAANTPEAMRERALRRALLAGRGRRPRSARRAAA